jgi:putative hemolysin
MKTTTTYILILVFLAILVIVGGYYFYQKVPKETLVEEKTTDLNSNQLANPASVNCTEKGGISTIATKEDGSQYGLCYFDDNKACEEWAMMQGNCPVGGVKTTGLDTIDQKFCAWSGGQTLAVPNSVCILPGGMECSTIDFYNGICPVLK